MRLKRIRTRLGLLSYLSRPRTGLEEFSTEVSVVSVRDRGRKLGKTRSEVWIDSSADRDEYGCYHICVAIAHAGEIGIKRTKPSVVTPIAGSFDSSTLGSTLAIVVRIR